MRKVLWTALIAFVLCYGYIPGAQPTEPLFTAPVDAIEVDLPPLNPSIVLRQRLVTIQVHLLADGDETTIDLNPFDDVQVIAVQERKERNAAGGYAWYGRVEDVPPAEVTLVVEDFKLAASITRGDRKYTVRHVSGDLHLVREIDLTAMPTSLGAPRTLTSALQATPSAFETEILTLVNEERASQNLHSLSWDTDLHDAARGHSVDMATNNYFSHTSQDGRTVPDRIQAAGYQYNSAGENIAAGYSTPEAAMNGWMNSSGHRANILNSTYCDLGVGYAYDSGNTYGHYWTQDFGRKTGVFSCPPPPGPVSIGQTAGDYNVPAEEELELFVKRADGAVREYLAFGAVMHGVSTPIYVLSSARGVITLGQFDPPADGYAYRDNGSTGLIVTMSSLGLHAGDQFIYAYGYEDSQGNLRVSHVVVGNIR